MVTPEILTIYLTNFILTIFLFISFLISIKIVFKFNINDNSSYQYQLLKQNYLAQTIIKISLLLKIILFLFFIYTIDKLSNLIIGAMCGVGVINGYDYGIGLFIFKIINLYLFSFWLVLNKKDNSFINYPFTKIKYLLFILLFFIFLAELYFEFDFFSSLNPNKLVTCCSSIYSSASSSLIGLLLKLDTKYIIGLFYINFILILVFYKNKIVFSLLNIIFIVVSISSLISFFATYIYELPTHHCPFCLLQGDYNYIGYFIYTFLFLGTFSGFVSILVDFRKKSIFFNTLVVIIYTYYPISYYIKNSVFL